jgi:uncharacterized membrane protein
MNAEAKTPISEIMLRARAALRGRWGKAVVVILVYFVLLCAGQLPSESIGLFLALVLGAASFIITPPLAYGLSALFLRMSRGENVRVANLFDGFKCFGFTWKLYFWLYLYVILWCLPALVLLIAAVALQTTGSIWALPLYGLAFLAALPAIWKLLSYAQVYYAAIDDPTLTARESLRASRDMMQGNKGRFLLLLLRAMAWMLLGVAALLIGALWAYAYMIMASVQFYEDLRARGAGEESGGGDGGRGEIRTHG